MAGLNVVASSGAVASGTSAKTLVQIVAPSNHRLLVRRLSVSMQGTNPNQTPILIELIQQTSAGTSTSGAATKANQSDDETPQSTVLTAFTVEPTGSTVVESFYLQTTGIPLIYDWPLTAPLVVPGSQRLGVRATADTTTQVRAQLNYEE